MNMRLLIATLLTVASFGCSDDEGEDRDGGSIDGGSDASTGDTDAEAPAMDARVTDASDEDASDLSDAGDSGGDAGACLERSYIWSLLEECFDEASQHIARRVTLAEFCEDFECPADWNAALAAAAACEADVDAGADPDECWTASTECGADLLRSTVGPDSRFLHYDHATGELIGGAVQLTDTSEECVASEVITGERPPICCEDTEP